MEINQLIRAPFGIGLLVGLGWLALMVVAIIVGRFLAKQEAKEEAGG